MSTKHLQLPEGAERVGNGSRRGALVLMRSKKYMAKLVSDDLGQYICGGEAVWVGQARGLYRGC